MTTEQADQLIYIAGRIEVWLMLIAAMGLIAAGYKLTSFFMRERSGLISGS